MAVEAIYRIGRDSKSQIVIDDTSVSREHAELHVLADGRVRLIDLGSMNGVRLRDGAQWRRIDGSAVVSPDDAVRFGDHATTPRSLLNKLALGAGAGPVRAGDFVPAPAIPPFAAAPAAGGEFARLIRRTTVPAPKEPSGTSRQEPSLHLSPLRRPGAATPPREPLPIPSAALPQLPPVAPAPVVRRLSVELPPLPGSADRRAGMALAAAAGYRTPSEVSRAVSRPEPAADELPDTPPPLASPNRPSLPSSSALRRRQRSRNWAIAASALLVGCGVAYGAVMNFKIGWFRAAPDHAAAPPPAAGPVPPGAAADRAEALPPKDTPPAAPSPAAEERSVPPVPAARAWTSHVPGIGASAIFAAAAHPKGGACLAGETSLPGGGMEAWIVRLDDQGKTLWQRRPGGPRRDAATAIAASPDGGCLAAGYADDESKIWISRLGPAGQQVWERTFGAGERSRATAIVRLREGGYVIAATARKTAAGPSHAVLIRVSADGDLRWNKVLAAPESALNDVQEMPGGGFVTAGWGRAKSSDPHGVWITRLDRNGAILWQRLMALDGAPLSAFVRPASDGSVVVVTSANTGAERTGASLRAIRLGTRGETLWDRAEAMPGPGRAAGLVLVKGGFVVAGDAGSTGKPEIWLARFDDAGGLAHRERFAASAADRAAALAPLRDGRLLLTGTAEIGAGGLKGAGLRFLGKQETAER